MIIALEVPADNLSEIHVALADSFGGFKYYNLAVHSTHKEVLDLTISYRDGNTLIARTYKGENCFIVNLKEI